MKDKILQKIKNDPHVLSMYLSAMQNLVDSGIFNFMRLLSAPMYSVTDSPEQVALRGAESRGFNTCLDVLFNFKEMFLDDSKGAEKPEMTFGSLETNYYTKEELNAIKSGSTDRLINEYVNKTRTANSTNKAN